MDANVNFNFEIPLHQCKVGVEPEVGSEEKAMAAVWLKGMYSLQNCESQHEMHSWKYTNKRTLIQDLCNQRNLLQFNTY